MNFFNYESKFEIIKKKLLFFGEGGGGGGRWKDSRTGPNQFALSNSSMLGA